MFEMTRFFVRLGNGLALCFGSNICFIQRDCDLCSENISLFIDVANTGYVKMGKRRRITCPYLPGGYAPEIHFAFSSSAL